MWLTVRRRRARGGRRGARGGRRGAELGQPAGVDGKFRAEEEELGDLVELGEEEEVLARIIVRAIGPGW